VQVLQLLSSGLTLGAIYALVALGFHVVFRMTGIIDFAQGDKVVVGGLVGLTIIDHGLSNVVLVLILMLAIGLVFGAVYDVLVILPSQRNGSVAAVAATVGMSLVLANGHQVIYGPNARTFPPVVGGSFKVGDLLIAWQSVVIWTVLLVVGVAFGLLMTRTRIGRGMIAAATDATAATAAGINVSRSRSIAFGLAFGLATLAGVLIAPITLAGGALGTSLTLKGFTGAVLGGLSSTTGTIVGALLLGVFESEIALTIPDGAVEPAIFGALIVVLLVMPNGLFGLRRQRLA
jgi:branched-chain amino acid transport system permease protein